MAKSYQIALAQTREMLSDVDFTAYETILFVGKSIGTIAAAEIAVQYGLHDRVHFVLYTPLEETFRYPLGNAVAFTGSADPWVKEGVISELCEEQSIPCHVIPLANHSLETGRVRGGYRNFGKGHEKDQEVYPADRKIKRRRSELYKNRIQHRKPFDFLC